jgi:alkanesulfonate monooxygenase SsuD/methylene tetrahydromethanopterin reductase-like flavin-dependent oxidoreductase (luciferase family)
MGHPIWSVKWPRTTVPSHLKTGLARGGKQRTDVHVNYWFWVTPNNDVQQSVEDARAYVAFFAGMEQYEEYFAAHGFHNECKHLQEGVKHRDYRSVAHLVPDEMASTFIVTGTPSDVRRKIEPVWEFADSVCLIPPILSLDPEQAGQYFATIAETFYS